MASKISPPQLTSREKQVLFCIAIGKTRAQAADFIGISVKSIDAYRQRLAKKTNAKCIASLTRYAISQGVIPACLEHLSDMTGSFVRVNRNGRMQPVEIENLSQDEFDSLEKSDPTGGWKYARELAEWIKRNVKP